MRQYGCLPLLWSELTVADDNRSPLEDAGTMGMYLLIAALGMLFAASVVGYLVIRSSTSPGRRRASPSCPASLWLSTLCILLCSVTIQRHCGPSARGELPASCGATWRSRCCWASPFSPSQTFAWWQVVRQIQQPSENLGPYLKLFYVLTGLHAAHVLGGLGTLAVVARRAWAGRYSPSYYPGVRYSAIYWHFLDAVWCVLFVVVYLDSEEQRLPGERTPVGDHTAPTAAADRRSWPETSAGRCAASWPPAAARPAGTAPIPAPSDPAANR